MSYDYQDFLREYEPQYTQIKSVLAYLNTYPDLMLKLKLDKLIKPEALDIRQQDWVRIVSKYDGLEKDFFKPYWVPIEANSLGVFIDLSDKDLPVFEMEYFFFKPYHYFKTFLFYKISDLLMATEQDINFKEFEEQKLASIFGQADIYFEMRKRMGLGE